MELKNMTNPYQSMHDIAYLIFALLLPPAPPGLPGCIISSPFHIENPHDDVAKPDIS
jgi:hypothetical protein